MPSRGKGGRDRPWRDGGARKTSCKTSWRSACHDAVAQPHELESPRVSIKIYFYGTDATEELETINDAFSERGIRYAIKSRGKRGATIFPSCRYEIEVSAFQEVFAREVLQAYIQE